METGRRGSGGLVSAGLVAIAGAQIRTYRIAIATTAEYTAFHGGTVESGLAEVVTVLNRVSGVLERDASIRLILVDRNDRLIYTDPNSDPYTPENREQITGENQANVDGVIGTQNYDIGHVFSAYPGGRADTHLRPIRCRSVDLRLSIDSGRTFPILLATKTRNDGFATVTVPPLTTGKARIQVACSNNIFFAISDGNFRIQR